MPAVVISMESERVDNGRLLDHLNSEVALEKPEIRCTDRNIPINNNCTVDEQQFGIPEGGRDFQDEGDESDAPPTGSRRRLPSTELVWIELGTGDVDRYEGEEGNNVDADETQVES
jgi:hypothetical protein